MDKLDQVALFHIATMLDLDNLLSLCQANERINRLICLPDAIWLFKLNKEFPDWRQHFNGKSVRKVYSLLVGLSKLKEWMKYKGSVYELFYQEKLVLSEREIEKLPSEICELTNLQELYLFDNQIKTLPPEIGKLRNLRVLDLFGNRIEKLPSEIGKLTNLQELYLFDNQIKTLPPEIGKLRNLRVLDLFGNRIEKLPSEIGKLTNLQQLTLDRKVTNVPKNLKDIVGYLK